jgi:hypothetical protein
LVSGCKAGQSQSRKGDRVECRKIDRQFKTEGSSSYKGIEDAVRIYKRKVHVLHFVKLNE